MLSLESIFRSDYEDGSLEQLVLSDHPLFVIVLGKVAAHWCTTGLLLTLISPALAISLAFPPQNLGTLLWTLLLGTPTLSLIGSIGVALTVGLRRGGILLALLILPLYIPILIFGASAVDMSIDNLDVGGQLYLLAALLVLSLTLAPFATSAALRVTLE
jgi:heme exporter protein B